MKTRLFLLFPFALAAAGAASGADDSTAPTNAVQVLEARLEKGDVKLAFANDGHGYLKSVLAALQVSPASQVVSFTKSSLQFDRISPGTPRAIYFNDEVAVGAVHPGGLIEIIANDRRGGIAFYTLDNNAAGRPRIEEESARCISCHGLVNTVTPGWIVANITATADGTPQIADPAHAFDFTDQTRPFQDRWGGWYVTGHSENMMHLGNVTAPDPDKPFDLPQGQTLASLSGRFDPAHTLTQSSDIVALMTLEHQTGFINRAFALNVQPTNAALDDLASYMTFANEAGLPGPVAGDSAFAGDFAKRGPRDREGRSLRLFDLKSRLFRYPLSYMIYSSSFDALKPDIRDKLYKRLYDLLKAKGADGAETIAILAATKPGLPDYWK